MRTTSRSGINPAGSTPRNPAVDPGGARFQHDEAASADVFLANQIQAGLRLLVGRDHDVLEQIAETRFDRALVFRLDIEIVGDRALLADMAVGLREHHARRLGVAGSRFSSSVSDARRAGQARELALPRPQVVRLPLELDAGGGQLGFARGLRVQRRFGRPLARRRPSAVTARSSSSRSCSIRTSDSSTPSLASSSDTRCALLRRAEWHAAA